MPKPIDIPKMAFDAMESLQPLFDGAKKAQGGLASSLRASNVPEPLVQGLDNLLTMMVPTSGADALLSMAPGARVVNQPAVLNTARKAGLSVFPKTFTLLPNSTLSQFVGKRSDDLVALHEATLGRSKATPEMLAALKVRMQRSMDDEINMLGKTNPEWFADAKAKGWVDEFGRHNIKLPTTPKGIPSGTREAADKIADAKILKNREFENMRRNQARIKKATEEQLNAGNLANPELGAINPVGKPPSGKRFNSAVREVARKDLVESPSGVQDLIDQDARGTILGRLSGTDEVFDASLSSKAPKWYPTADEYYNSFANARSALREQYGDTIQLWRAQGADDLLPNKHTLNYASKPQAELFVVPGRKLISREVPVEDVLGINVGKKGSYEEFIVLNPEARGTVLPNALVSHRKSKTTVEQLNAGNLANPK